MLTMIDRGLLNFFSLGIKNPVFDKIMPIITRIDNNYEVWIAAALALIIIGIIILGDDRRKGIYWIQTGVLILIALLAAFIIGELVIKNIIQRGRPLYNVKGFQLLIPTPSGYSFPSGHAFSSFAAAGVLYFRKFKYRYVALALATVIAFSRIYLHVHYPSDILGGMLLGLLCSYVIVKISKLFNCIG